MALLLLPKMTLKTVPPPPLSLNPLSLLNILRVPHLHHHKQARHLLPHILLVPPHHSLPRTVNMAAHLIL